MVTYFGPCGISLILSAPGYGHLNKGGSYGRYDHHDQSPYQTACTTLIVIRAAKAPEQHGPLGHSGDVGYGARYDSSYGAYQYIPVADMCEFVCKDPFQLLAVEEPQDTLCDRDRSVVRVPPGGKGIRGLLGYEVNLGLRYPGLLRESCYYRMELRGLCFRNLPGPAHLQGKLVAVPVSKKVHRAGHHQGYGHACAATQCPSDEQKESREGG